MTKITYEIVQRDGGWAYRPTECSPRRSRRTTWPARRRNAQRKNKASREATSITYEDKDGRWHSEVASGTDRPETDVEG